MKAICFGEVLIDVFPDQSRIGGAPLNVAVRLRNQGVAVKLVSRIANDSRGRQIKAYLLKEGVGVEYLQEDSQFPTGTVQVTLDDKEKAVYKIEKPAAWDDIEFSTDLVEELKTCDFFIFGSLACRTETTRRSLFTYLEIAQNRILDFNLRPPHYTEDLLVELLQRCDVIKLNDEELFELTSILKSPYYSLEQNLKFLIDQSSAKMICVTQGRFGAVLLKDDIFFYNSGYRIKVEDSVGAGDSFLATLLIELKKGSIQAALNKACAVGALVASRKGANPQIRPLEIQKILEGGL